MLQSSVSLFLSSDVITTDCKNRNRHQLKNNDCHQDNFPFDATLLPSLVRHDPSFLLLVSSS